MLYDLIIIGGDIKHSFASITLAEEKISYQPQLKFIDGLLKTIEWYKLNRSKVDNAKR